MSLLTSMQQALDLSWPWTNHFFFVPWFHYLKIIWDNSFLRCHLLKRLTLNTAFDKAKCPFSSLPTHTTPILLTLHSWHILTNDSIFIYLRALGHAEKSNNVIYGGDFESYSISSTPRKLEIKVHYVGSWPCLCDWTPIKILNIVSNEICYLATLCAYYDMSLPGGVNHVPDSNGSGQLKNPHLLIGHSWTLPHHSLSFADFNLDPFTVVKHNCEYNSTEFCQSFYWIVKSKGILGPLNYNWRQRWEWSCRLFSNSSFMFIFYHRCPSLECKLYEVKDLCIYCSLSIPNN